MLETPIRTRPRKSANAPVRQQNLNSSLSDTNLLEPMPARITVEPIIDSASPIAYQVGSMGPQEIASAVMATK